MPPTDAEVVKEAIEKLNKNVNDRIVKLEELFKSIAGEGDDAGKALAECPDLVKRLREDVEKYTRQLPQMSKIHGSEKDSEYTGFWPNAERAAQFGHFVMAGLSPKSEIREACAKSLTESNIKLRTTNGQFAKHEDYVKAMGESTDSLGGYLVPDELMTTIIKYVNTYGVARQRLRKVPMASATQSWIVRSSGLTCYYPDEATAATASDASFTKVQLQAKRWAILVYISKELDEDSVVALGEYIAFEMALALATAEDTNTFMGDGTGTYGGVTGVMESSNVATVVMAAGKTGFADMDHDELVRLKYAVPAWVRKMPDCGYYMNSGIAGQAERLTDDNGRPMYNQPTEGHPLKIAGKPVEEVEAMPDTGDSAVSTKFVAFGSLTAWGMLGQRRSMTIEKNESVKFLEGQVALKAEPRQTIKEAVGEAMAVLQTAAE